MYYIELNDCEVMLILYYYNVASADERERHLVTEIF